MKLFAVALMVAAWTIAVQSAPAAPVSTDMELWRLDCGHIAVHDLSLFSDTFADEGKTMVLTDSCYLIRHGQDYMLWDTGLPKSVLGAPEDPKAPLSPGLDRDLVSQLKVLGVKPEQITRIGISHDHFDHLGQAADFPGATLMIGAEDWAQLQLHPSPFGVDASLVSPWLKGGKLDLVSGDRDVFGDGSVVMLATPGHTPGEMALLLRLPKTGAVILSGDVVHFEAQFARHGVPGFNWNRANSLASIDRLQTMARNLHATLVIQHDPADIAKLPLFPQGAH